MFTTNVKRSAAALAVTAGLFAAAAPASHAYSWGASNPTVKAPVSSYSWGVSNPTVKAKRAKGKHGKGKVAHGNQRTGATLNADMQTFNQAETLASS